MPSSALFTASRKMIYIEQWRWQDTNLLHYSYTYIHLYAYVLLESLNLNRVVTFTRNVILFRLATVFLPHLNRKLIRFKLYSIAKRIVSRTTRVNGQHHTRLCSVFFYQRQNHHDSPLRHSATTPRSRNRRFKYIYAHVCKYKRAPATGNVHFLQNPSRLSPSTTSLALSGTSKRVTSLSKHVDFATRKRFHGTRRRIAKPTRMPAPHMNTLLSLARLKTAPKLAMMATVAKKNRSSPRGVRPKVWRLIRPFPVLLIP